MDNLLQNVLPTKAYGASSFDYLLGYLFAPYNKRRYFYKYLLYKGIKTFLALCVNPLT